MIPIKPELDNPKQPADQDGLAAWPDPPDPPDLPDPQDPLAVLRDEELTEKPADRRRLLLVRLLALLLALVFSLFALGGILHLIGMPSLNFLLESRTLARDPQIREMIRAVVTVDADNRRGTGFNIDPSGLVVTNNHVVAGAGSVQIGFQSGPARDIQEWIQIPEVDLALIALEGRDLPVLELESETLPAQDESVILIGNPLGFFRVVNRAVFLGYTRLPGWDIPLLMIKGPVYKGNSGSPVINASGKVIGVIFATASPPDSEEIYAFAIPAAEIARQIEQIKQTAPVR